MVRRVVAAAAFQLENPAQDGLVWLDSPPPLRTSSTSFGAQCSYLNKTKEVQGGENKKVEKIKSKKKSGGVLEASLFG